MNINTPSTTTNNAEKILITPPKTVVCKQIIDTQINSIDFSEDTHSVAIACSDKTIRIFNSKSGNFTTTLHGSTDSVIKVKFSSVGQLALGACADSICRIWNLGNDRVRHTLTGHTKKIYGADFSPDSKKVVTGAHDRTIKFWELQYGTCEKTLLTCKSSVNDVEVSRGDTIASAHFDSAVRLWDMKSFKLISEIERAHDGQQVTSVSFSKDGTKLLSNGKDNLLNIYDLRMTQKVLDTLKHTDYKNTIAYNKACFSPCGEYCAAGGTNGKLFIWSLTPQTTKAMGSAVLVVNGHSSSITGVTWNIDGSQIASCGLDKGLFIYE
ncbi:autophagy related protein [Naegleria gruberi]|uniref:Autophagy related protein n=1 Tax=Naegleria gruberi TaxID=5762 RepID=D2VIR6_NAEGR|nr:autophagy related protein [Naegleria gruberi]EFC43397.1 autophagy related protein [Naegleria gruberi]|eukprot:XP_002676141.1 autophagy related protein [Naegleria gruberi strain NEG-M]